MVIVDGSRSLFLSTPSARRATVQDAAIFVPLNSISIHALREEGDLQRRVKSCHSHHFYPRPPRGGRRADVLYPLDHPRISIHALREEGDTRTATKRTSSGRFLSTPSARRATAASGRFQRPAPNFYPRPPRGGRRARSSLLNV